MQHEDGESMQAVGADKAKVYVFDASQFMSAFTFSDHLKKIITPRRKAALSISHNSFKLYCFKAFWYAKRGYSVFLVQKSVSRVAGFSEIKSCFDLSLLL